MRLILLIVMLTGFTGASASEDRFSSLEEVGKWFTYYYLEPEPERINSALQFMSESGTLDNASALPGIFGFLSGVFASNPDSASELVGALADLPDGHFSAVLLGYWYANLADSQTEVYRHLDSNKKLDEQLAFLRTGKPMALDEIPLNQGAWVLDALWGRYFATGNRAPVERIAEALPWSDVKGDIERLLVGGAAKWSLSSNVSQHDRVREIVVSLAEKDPQNQHLSEVLAQAAEYESEKKANK